MTQFSSRQQKIILLLIGQGSISSSVIHDGIIKNGENISLVTVKRELSELAKQGVIATSGAGRSTAYTVGTSGRIFADIDAHEYCAAEPDRRYGMKKYNTVDFPAACRGVPCKESLKTIGFQYKIEAWPSSKHTITPMRLTIT